MNYKKKSLILSIFLIICVQILLLINNKQKSSFKYFIWNIQDVSIGRLICLSFISGTIIGTILNKTSNNNIDSNPINGGEESYKNEIDIPINREQNKESDEIPPERDLRETQPTISVNYRVIKNNGENEIKDRSQISNNSDLQDDWNNNDPEW
tara:strand:+ start:124 stop:582 length:459 start_codon:yes stop_codon:yes gene_type:complete